MLNRKLLVIILFICLATLADASSQTRPRRIRPRPARSGQKNVRQTKTHQTTIASKSKIEVIWRFDFSLQAAPSKMTFVTPIPKTIAQRQQITNIEFLTKPLRTFDKNGTRYAEFAFSKPPTQFTLIMKINATLFKYDLATARKKDEQKELSEVDVNDFLKHERYIEKNDPKIQQIANSIKDSDRVSTVKQLYDYVADNIRYVNFQRELGAAKVLQRKQGACTEYSDLFVALCRAKGIPARVVKGFVTEPVNSPSPKHAWAEVYLKKYGWVPFDPTYGDVMQKTIRDNRFENLKPIYIYLSSIRNDELMDKAITMTGIFIGDVQVNDSLEFR